jgi:hypothetical protein
MEDAIDISNKTLDLLASAYPTYTYRVKSFSEEGRISKESI